MTISEWKSGKWKAGVAFSDGIESVSVDVDATKERHAAVFDLSSNGRSLVRGQQTAIVNATIMDVSYQPVNGPWLVDVDLPKRRDTRH